MRQRAIRSLLIARTIDYGRGSMSVYEKPEGLVVNAMLLAAPSPSDEDAIAICLKTPPGRIEALITHLCLPL